MIEKEDDRAYNSESPDTSVFSVFLRYNPNPTGLDILLLTFKSAGMRDLEHDMLEKTCSVICGLLWVLQLTPKKLEQLVKEFIISKKEKKKKAPKKKEERGIKYS